MYNTMSLRILGTIATDPTCSNCRKRLKDVTTIYIDETPLPKTTDLIATNIDVINTMLCVKLDVQL